MYSFLQSKDWSDFQQSLGRKTWHYNHGGVQALIIRHDLPFKKCYLYVPYGPDIDLGEFQGLKHSIAGFFAYVNRLAHEQNAVFVKVEPRSDMAAELLAGQKRGFKYSTKHIQPHKTLILDLSSDEDQLLSYMHSKTRYNIGLAEKKDITVSEGRNFDTFWALLKKTTEKDGFSSHPREYYEKLLEFFSSGHKRDITARLFFAYQKSTPLAGAIILEYGKTAYYLHGASDREYRALMAPHLMHWEIIKYYKRGGFQLYDFWGVDDKRWPGVSRFKHGFAGRVIEYPGAFDMPISTFWYWAYKLAQKFK